MIMIFTLHNKICYKRSENGQLGCASLYEMTEIDGIEHISTDIDLHIYFSSLQYIETWKSSWKLYKI